jgi:crotonobetainyl-CoA:carnitine CoA-transferase CaiB-like acyl-CoA transferase
MQYINLLLASVLSINPCITADRSRHSPLRNRFACRDGKWIQGTHHPEEKYWATFCRATDQARLLEDPHYTHESGKPVNFVELNRIFDEVFAGRSRDEWMEIFQAHGLMFCSVQQMGEVINDPQALANDYLMPFAHPVQGAVQIPGYPVQFSKCRAGTHSAAPTLGEHTDLVLQHLGFSDDDIEELKKSGIVR